MIIDTASIAAYEGQTAYSASKGGIVGMTLPAARDLASYGRRLNTVVLGSIHTPMFDDFPGAAYHSLSKNHLFPNRISKPEGVAQPSLSIVENDDINRECTRLDAGIRMQPL